MKSLIKTLVMLSMVLTVAVSCQEKEPEIVPTMDSEISLDTASIVVPASAGTYSISYRISSPAMGGDVEAICPDSWVNSFSYDAENDSTGVISFNVNENTGEDRTASVSVIYSNATQAATFTVEQANPYKVFASELNNTSWEATFCRFHRDSTIFNEVNPENQSELWYIKITAGEYADQYALDWNMANPDNLITAEDALSFEFTESVELTTFCHVRFYDGWVEVSDGMTTPAGGAELTRVYGEYKYDEDTGILEVHDVGNTLYEREVVYKIRREGDHITFRCTYMWWPDYMADYFDDNDRFGFVLPNYDGSRCFIPYGYLSYELIPWEDDELMQ